jgi:hypothetical protein
MFAVYRINAIKVTVEPCRETVAKSYERAELQNVSA